MWVDAPSWGSVPPVKNHCYKRCSSHVGFLTAVTYEALKGHVASVEATEARPLPFENFRS